MNYYCRHVGDYLRDTAHLSLLEHGIYTRLLDIYYVRESGIPEKDIHRLIGARTKEEKNAVQSVLTEFFELVSKLWIQHRCEREIEQFTDKRTKSKAAINTRWRNTKTQSDGNTDEIRTYNGRNTDDIPPSNHTPVTINQKKNTSAIAPPEGVDLVVWEDFLIHRKEKKAKLTQTAIEGIQREAAKAGWKLEDALRECCSRGWTGFKADWVAQRQGFGQQVIPITVPSRQGIDPALAKAINDQLTASKPSADIRAQMAKITGRTA